MGQNPIPPPDGYALPDNWKDWVNVNILADGYTPGDIWMFKDCKIALTWRLWHKHWPNAKWVLVWRDPAQVARSCMETPFMSEYNTEEEWYGLAVAYHSRMQNLARSVDAVSIHTEGMILDPDLLRFRLESLGLEFDREKVLEFVDPSLLRQRGSPSRSGRFWADHQ